MIGTYHELLDSTAWRSTITTTRSCRHLEDSVLAGQGCYFFSTTVFTTALLTISLPRLLCSVLMNGQADHLHDCYYATLSNCCLMHPQWQLATLALVVTVAVEAVSKPPGSTRADIRSSTFLTKRRMSIHSTID